MARHYRMHMTGAQTVTYQSQINHVDLQKWLLKYCNIFTAYKHNIHAMWHTTVGKYSPEMFPETLRYVELQLAAGEMCKYALHVLQHLEIVVLAFVRLDDRLFRRRTVIFQQILWICLFKQFHIRNTFRCHVMYPPFSDHVPDHNLPPSLDKSFCVLGYFDQDLCCVLTNHSKKAMTAS